jgi:hypothetical protein
MHYSFGVEKSYTLHHLKHHILDERLIKLLPIIFNVISQTLPIHQIKNQPKSVFKVESLPTRKHSIILIFLRSLHHLNLPLNSVHFRLLIRFNELEYALSFVVVPAQQKDTTGIACSQTLLDCVEL